MRERHSINGKLRGVYCTTASGRRAYLAVRTKRDMPFKKQAWCIEVRVLERCQEEGITIVGVLQKQGKKNLMWLTPLSDFFDSPHSFAHMGDARERGLPLSKFRVDPAKCEQRIETAVKLR